jgi:hypothetical protein
MKLAKALITYLASAATLLALKAIFEGMTK